jgi:hypothetical protein
VIDGIPSYRVLLSALRSAFVAGGGHSRNLSSVHAALRCTDEVARAPTETARSALLRVAADHLRHADADAANEEELRALALARKAMTVALFECDDSRRQPRAIK